MSKGSAFEAIALKCAECLYRHNVVETPLNNAIVLCCLYCVTKATANFQIGNERPVLAAAGALKLELNPSAMNFNQNLTGINPLMHSMSVCCHAVPTSVRRCKFVCRPCGRKGQKTGILAVKPQNWIPFYDETASTTNRDYFSNALFAQRQRRRPHRTRTLGMPFGESLALDELFRERN